MSRDDWKYYDEDIWDEKHYATTGSSLICWLETFP
jgi:hypothetical protein